MRPDMYVYRVLSAGESDVFPKIDDALLHMGVSGSYSEMRTGGRIYRVAVCETDALPNRNGPVLPTGMRRNSPVYPLGKLPDVENLRSQWRCGEWREIRGKD